MNPERFKDLEIVFQENSSPALGRSQEELNGRTASALVLLPSFVGFLGDVIPLCNPRVHESSLSFSHALKFRGFYREHNLLVPVHLSLTKD